MHSRLNNVKFIMFKAHLLLHLHYTGRTLNRYHARVCDLWSGMTLPELLKMISYCCLEGFNGLSFFDYTGLIIPNLGCVDEKRVLESICLG